jgi:Holliday junction resolvase RusA-like endonuclease
MSSEPTKPVESQTTRDCNNASNRGEAPGCYSYVSGSQIKYEFTNHLRSFACKISGRPRPQYRSYATTTKAKGRVKLYSPSAENQKSFRDAFKDALNYAPKQLFRCNGNPCSITVKFYFPRPKTHFLLGPASQEWLLKPTAPKFVTNAPDIDNCVKLVLDALQGIAYKNDSCIVNIATTKLYDHTQTTYKDGVNYDGTTLIKVVEIDPTVKNCDCKCFHCAK